MYATARDEQPDNWKLHHSGGWCIRFTLLRRRKRQIRRTAATTKVDTLTLTEQQTESNATPGVGSQTHENATAISQRLVNNGLPLSPPPFLPSATVHPTPPRDHSPLHSSPDSLPLCLQLRPVPMAHFSTWKVRPGMLYTGTPPKKSLKR